MRHFIILRGPTACGKTSVAGKLMQYLGKEETCFINLDNRPKAEELDSINTENCVAELFYGDDYTAQPEAWISRLKARGFAIWSVVLRAKLETCLERNKWKKDPLDPSTVIDNYRRYADASDGRFAEVKNFAWKGEISEVVLDADLLDAQTTARQIVKCIGASEELAREE